MRDSALPAAGTWPPPPPPEAVCARIEEYLCDQRVRLYAAYWQRVDGQMVPEVRLERGIIRRWVTNLLARAQPLTRKP